MENSFVTVVIPTFKRHDILFRALNSLQNQNRKDFGILVVNNNIEDGLKEKIDSYNESNSIYVNYINYPKKGLFGARNAGAQYAKSEVLIYYDDDETCVPNFIDLYTNLFKSNPNVMVAGGPCIVTFEEEPEQWVKDYLGDKSSDNVWGHFDPHKEPIIDEVVNVWGGNMAIRRSILSWTGFHPDVINGKLLGAGESGLVKEVAETKGALMAFLPDAKIFHHIPAQRLTLKHVRWSASYVMNMRVYFKYREIEPKPLTVIEDMFFTIFEYYKLWIKDLFIRNRKDKNSVDIQYLASMGFWKMRYLYWLLFNKQVKDFIKKDKYITLEEIL